MCTQGAQRRVPFLLALILLPRCKGMPVEDLIPPPRAGLDSDLEHYSGEADDWRLCRMMKPFEVDGITYTLRGNASSVLVQPMIGLKYVAERRDLGIHWDGPANMICSERWCEDCWLYLATREYWPCGRKHHKEPEPVPTYI
jgi:hypothetical protein